MSMISVSIVLLMGSYSGFGSWKETKSSYQMLKSYAPIIGGAAGGFALVMIVIMFLWFCMSQCKKSNKNSETGSSDPSMLVECNKQAGSSSAGGSPLSGPQEGKQFMLDELEHATKQFSESNVIGHGSFGLVYKGLLHDGTVVAVKKRRGPPKKELVEEACYLSQIQHRSLVNLLGYCQEDGSQMLIFDYISNGNVCGHLYESRQGSNTLLEFKQRLSIALGAAKGLHHLHCLKPPLVHRNFKTANVLVDENFTAKVADAGVSKLLERIEEAGPSSRTGESRLFSEMSDIYSFGIFLLELITGQEASLINLGSGESLEQWVELHASSNYFIDCRLAGYFTLEGMKDLIKLASWCMRLAGKDRPKMVMVVTELDRILENEMTLTTVMGEGIPTITLGSQLFASR